MILLARLKMLSSPLNVMRENKYSNIYLPPSTKPVFLYPSLSPNFLYPLRERK